MHNDRPDLTFPPNNGGASDKHSARLRRALHEPVSALEGMAFVLGALFALACVRWGPVLFAIVGAAG